MTTKTKQHVGQETMQQFIIRRWQEWRAASSALKGEQTTVQWSNNMAAYRAAKRNWVLAESLAKCNAITL